MRHIAEKHCRRSKGLLAQRGSVAAQYSQDQEILKESMVRIEPIIMKMHIYLIYLIKIRKTYSRNQSKSESEWNDMLENSGPGPTEKAGGKTMRRIQAVAKVC